jgi:hypothetical protein
MVKSKEALIKSRNKGGTPSGAKEAAEKLDNSDEIGGKHTSGPKGPVDFIVFMPGINPRPTFKTEFFRSL